MVELRQAQWRPPLIIVLNFLTDGIVSEGADSELGLIKIVLHTGNETVRGMTMSTHV
jgi:hypothetical protein